MDQELDDWLKRHIYLDYVSSLDPPYSDEYLLPLSFLQVLLDGLVAPRQTKQWFTLAKLLTGLRAITLFFESTTLPS